MQGRLAEAAEEECGARNVLTEFEEKTLWLFSCAGKGIRKGWAVALGERTWGHFCPKMKV